MQVAAQVLPCAMLKKLVATWRKVLQEVDSLLLSAKGFATCLVMFMVVARRVSLCKVFCNLPRNGLARQVVRKNAQCNSTLNGALCLTFVRNNSCYKNFK